MNEPIYSGNDWLLTPGRSTDLGLMVSQDFGVQEWLDALQVRLQQTGQTSRLRILLQQREQFRLILQDRPSKGLHQWLWLHGSNKEASPIALWLFGRSVFTQGAAKLAELDRRNAPLAFARRLAKELYRHRAWRDLRVVSAEFPSEEIVQRLVNSSPESAFESRLVRFTRHLDHSRSSLAEGPSRMPLWFSSEFWQGRKARSAQLIRAALERIHRLVHGA